jgi:hypothetical protein
MRSEGGIRGFHVGAGAVHCEELRVGRRRQIEIHEEERQGDVGGGIELKLTGGCLEDELENTVGFAIAKIIAGVLFADLDTNAIGLSWVCASNKLQKL